MATVIEANAEKNATTITFNSEILVIYGIGDCKIIQNITIVSAIIETANMMDKFTSKRPIKGEELFN